MKKVLITLLILIILFWWWFSYLYINPELPLSQKILSMVGIRITTNEVTQIENPASVFCEQKNWTIEFVTDSNWWQSWLCHLPDGNICDERAYFRWECPKIITESIWIVETIWTETTTKTIETEKYKIIREETDNWNKQNFFVYDKAWNKIFSSLNNRFCSTDPIIIWDLIVFINNCRGSTSSIKIYNITTNENILDLNYYEFSITWNKINILTLVHERDYNENKIHKPNNAPECPANWWDQFWYSEKRILDLSNNEIKINKTWEFVCTFLE